MNNLQYPTRTTDLRRHLSCRPDHCPVSLHRTVITCPVSNVYPLSQLMVTLLLNLTSFELIVACGIGLISGHIMAVSSK